MQASPCDGDRLIERGRGRERERERELLLGGRGCPRRAHPTCSIYARDSGVLQFLSLARSLSATSPCEGGERETRENAPGHLFAPGRSFSSSCCCARVRDCIYLRIRTCTSVYICGTYTGWERESFKDIFKGITAAADGYKLAFFTTTALELFAKFRALSPVRVWVFTLTVYWFRCYYYFRVPACVYDFFFFFLREKLIACGSEWMR